MHLAEVLTYARAELGAEAEARPAS
jgi:hypothetical protein